MYYPARLTLQATCIPHRPNDLCRQSNRIALNIPTERRVACLDSINYVVLVELH